MTGCPVDGACFETRLAALLSMTVFYGWQKENRHPEEAAKRLSRRTQWPSSSLK
jgi:hypothetical protein